MKYDLMNLDLGARPLWREFEVGPYRIVLVPNYEDRQLELSSLQGKRIILDEQFQPSEEEIIKEAKAGKNSVTATAECADETEALLWAKAELGIYDLCSILSYLTGRNVFLPQDERRYSQIVHGHNVVCDWEVPRAAQLAWSNRANFRSEREKRPLWLYLNLISISDAEVTALLGCVALEIIQEVDASQAEAPPPGFCELINKLRSDIDQSDISDEDLKNRLKSAVGKWGINSAQEKFKSLLAKYSLAESDLCGLPLKRVRGIWDMRNRIAHNGEFADPKWVDEIACKKTVQVFIAARLIPALVMDYLNRRFGLLCLDRVRRNSGIIREYIYHGTHEGEDIDGIRT